MTDPKENKNGRSSVRGRRALRNAGAILTAAVFAVSLFSTVFSLAGASSARAADREAGAPSVVDAEELVLPVTRMNAYLPCGQTARWTQK